MSNESKKGWNALLEGFPWFTGEGRFPLPAYSEFMPPPRLGRKPLGAADPLMVSADDPYGWPVSEIEEEYELKPGMERLASRILTELSALSRGEPAHSIAGHGSRNLESNPYWPPELSRHAGRLDHERYVVIVPLALSRTQDDMGRVRWTLFGGSEQGPEKAFWKGFGAEPGREWPDEQARAFILRLLGEAFGIRGREPTDLEKLGFRVVPSQEYPERSLPAWTRPFLARGSDSMDAIRFVLTFESFARLPEQIRERYLAGKLHLIPFPGSLVFWGMPTYRRLSRKLPLAMQIPILRLASRHAGPYGIRVPQSGWIHEPHPNLSPADIQTKLIHNSYARTHRWKRVHRYDDELAMNPRVDRMARVLFSTALEVMGLYDKPMARNCQIWSDDFRLLLDGPKASRDEIQSAEAAIVAGGLFGYRFCFPAMHVGEHQVFWHRPLVAFLSETGDAELLPGAPLGYLTAYHDGSARIDQPVELWPRLQRRELFLSALQGFESQHDRYQHQTALNILSILHWHAITGRPVQKGLARHLLRTAKDQPLEEWLESLSVRAHLPEEGLRMRQELGRFLDPHEETLPDPLTFRDTAARSFEEAWWADISLLAHGHYVNKDNADCVLDLVSQNARSHHQRDLERLGDYLVKRHRAAIKAAGMDGLALCGEVPFHWRTDFDFSRFGGWKQNQEGKSHERNILVIIPGKCRREAVVLADHYDTAYMEDVFEPARGGSGARLAAAGADDNHSATATLLQAASIFLRLARQGLLQRDVWLLHLTGEEFPSDCLGARHFCRSLVEGTLRLHLGDRWIDLSAARVRGVVVMDMIAHNREDAQDVFQISPGKSGASLHIAAQAHRANLLWNSRTREWNREPERRGRGHARRSKDGITIPEVALHPQLHGEIRLPDKPHSSLYNTDGQIFSDVGVPVILIMENYDISRTGYHDTHDTMKNIDLDYGSAVAAIAIETVARLATESAEPVEL